MKFCVCKLNNKSDLTHLEYIAKRHNVSPRGVVAFFDNRIQWFDLMNEFGAIVNSDKTTKFIPSIYVGMRPLSIYTQSFKFYKYWFNVKENETDTIHFDDSIFCLKSSPPSMLPSRLDSICGMLMPGHEEVLPNHYIITDNVWCVVDDEQLIPYIRFPYEAVPREGNKIISNMVLDSIGDIKRIVYILMFEMKRVGICMLKYLTKFFVGRQVRRQTLEHIQWGDDIRKHEVRSNPLFGI